jgi:hypothetical protein
MRRVSVCVVIVFLSFFGLGLLLTALLVACISKAFNIFLFYFCLAFVATLCYSVMMKTKTTHLSEEISWQELIDACEDNSSIPVAEILNRFGDKLPGESRVAKGMGLSRLLMRFNIYAVNIRFKHGIRRGYKTCDFECARDGLHWREIKPKSVRSSLVAPCPRL